MHVTSADQASSQTHRIILLRGEPPQVLIGCDGRYRALPSVDIPRWQRIAESLTAGLHSKYGITAVFIGSVALPPTGANSAGIAYEIMEPCKPGQDAPLGKYWLSVDELTEECFRDPSDFHALQLAVRQSTPGTESDPAAPFGRLGWFEELEEWVQQEIRPYELCLNGRFRQLNASPTFNLIRFESNGPAVWFKAVGSPNEREYPVTLALTRFFPRFVPTMIATRPEWNAWLSLETEGPLLSDESCGLLSWKATARDLAELQVDSIGRGLHLLEAGARDLRAHSLSARVAPFFAAVDELMGRQRKTSPAPLTREELGRLSKQVQEALTIFEESDIPTSLGHLDFNPGNIIARLTGCVFLDWAEAFVGHPFLTFEYLREHFRRTLAPDPDQEAELLSCYSHLWRGQVSERQICRAFEVAPLVAIFAFAAGNDLWTDVRQLQVPRVAGYLRSLARQMDREARALAERSAPCPS